jgi:hypothetical protein
MSFKDKEELGDLIVGGSSGGGEGEFLKPRVFIPLTCASLIALVCGTTNAMASSGLADDITEYFNQGRSSTDLVITSTHEQTLISVGLIGNFLPSLPFFILPLVIRIANFLSLVLLHLNRSLPYFLCWNRQ